MTDVILLLILLLFSYAGYKRGFAKTIIALASNVLSLVLSMLLSKPVSILLFNSALGNIITEKSNAFFAELCSIAISFVLLSALIKIVIFIVADAVNLVMRLPVLKSVNKLLGALLGIVSGVVICYIVIGVAGLICEEAILTSIENSQLARKFYESNIIIQTFKI